MSKATQRTRRADQRTERVTSDKPTTPIIAPGEIGAQLLYSREQAQRLLGDVSKATVKRMEESGRLNPIRPTGAATGKVFYTGANLIAVTRGSGDEAR